MPQARQIYASIENENAPALPVEEEEEQQTQGALAPTAISDPTKLESAEPTRQIFEQTRPTRLEEAARETPLRDIPQKELESLEKSRLPIAQSATEEIIKRETPRDLTYKEPIGKTGAVSSATGEALGPDESHLAIQRSSIKFAKGFYTGKEIIDPATGEKTLEYVDFPPKVTDADTRYRLMRLYGGTSLAAYDENGAPFVVPNPDNPASGKQFFIEMIPARKLRDITKDPETKGGKFLDALNAVLVGGGKPVTNLQELDERLKNTPLNEYGRLQFLQMVKAGAFDSLRATQDLAGMVAFALESPDYVAQGVLGLTGVIMESWNYLTASVPPGETATFEPGKYITNYYDVPGVIEMMSQKHNVSADVLHEVLRTQGVGENLVKYGAAEGITYGPMAMFKMGSALSKFNSLEKEAMRRFGGKNFAEAMDLAWEQGIDYATFRNQFINQQGRKYSLNAYKESLDTGVALAIGEASSEAREPVFRAQVQRLDEQIDEAAEALQNAITYIDNTPVNVDVDSKIVTQAKKRLENLQNQRNTLLYERVTPSSLRNLGAEYGYTVGAMSGFTEAYRTFWGGSGESQPLWEFGSAMAMGFETGRQGVQKTGRGSWGVMKNLGRWLLSRKDNPLSWGFSDFYKEVRASEKLDIKTKNFFKELDKLGPEVQAIFMAGAEESTLIQRDLIALANATGITINPDMLFETVGDVGMMGSLITLGRSVDQQLTLTDFSNAGPMILQKEQNSQNRLAIVTKMAEALQQLTKLTISANAGPDSPVYQFQRRLQKFLELQSDSIFRDQQALRVLTDTPAQFFEIAMKGDYHQLSGGLSDIQTISQIYDFQTRAAGLGMSTEMLQQLNLTPSQAFQQALEILDENSKQVRKLLEEAGSTITPEMASTGAASVHGAKAFTVLRREIDIKADVLYKRFDLNNEKARSDISSIMRQINNNPTAFIDFNPDEVSQGLISIEKGSLRFKDRRGIGALFDSAADRTLKYFRRELGDGFQTLMGDLKVENDHPASQWMALDDFLKSTEAREAFGEDTVTRLQKHMPLLATPKEWRIIDRALGQSIGQYDNNAYYRGLRQQWREVGNPESPMAWKTGWDAGNPQNVAPEKMAEWQEAQKFYEDNVADRIYYSPKFRQWDGTLTDAGKKAVSEGGDITRELSKVSPNLKATQWLDDGLQSGLSLLRSRQSNLPLVGDELYTEFGELVGKLGGVKDPVTGQFFLITASDAADDAAFVASGKEVQRSIQLWLQGKAINSATGGKLLRGDYDPNMVLDQKALDALITSFENIPVYRRTKSGNLEMVGPLVNGEEVRRVIDPSGVSGELVYGAEKLGEAKALATDFVTNVKQQSELYIRNVEEESRIVESAMKRLQLGDKYTGVSDYQKTAKAVFDATVSGDFMDTEIPALKKALTAEILQRNANMPVEEATMLVDDAVRNLVMTHIEKTISKAGDSFPMQIEKTGEYVYMPSIGIDHLALYDMIGLTDPRKAAQLKSIIGESKYEMLVTIGRTVERIAAREKTMVGVSGRVPSISLETGLSRGLQVQKQTVSTQYVAFELLLRSARSRAGTLLKSMLNDPELGKQVLRAIDTGEVPPSMAQPNVLRQLVLEMYRQEALYSNTTDFLSGEFESLKLTPPEEQVAQALPLKAQPFAEQVSTDVPEKKLPEVSEEQKRIDRVKTGLRELGFKY